MNQTTASERDRIAINTLRFLAVDMVEQANSGHPGAPMGQAAMAYVLWTRFLRHSPEAPTWPNRDRFVLSCGHASALLYSLLHLAGYDLPEEELRNFRQLGSKTAGHPEYDPGSGIETTTGPLGQGLGNAVGMALAHDLLAQRFNRDEFPIFDHHVWVFASDGDLMEGVAAEASSLAGHLGLGRLIVVYDDNRISIDGATDLTFSEDVVERYRAYGWHTQKVDDGNDPSRVEAAFEAARQETSRPSLIAVRTHIGFGSPNKQDTAASHGSPLGMDEVRLTKENLGWPPEPAFHVPDEARMAFADNAARGNREQRQWQQLLASYREAYPDLAEELDRRLSRRLPQGWQSRLAKFVPADGPIATRKASGKVLNSIAEAIPELVGGSADLTGSNNTWLDDCEIVAAGRVAGRNLHFGVREHGMGAILNGLALSQAILPYGGTFLVFSDYMRPAIRLAALMKLPVRYVFTHDSIFLGEDGPTHQPVSQLLSLRSIPNLMVLRPADAAETSAAWRVALEHTAGPTAIVLTRQKVPVLEATAANAARKLSRGAYIVSEPEQTPEVILIASGSEVGLALAANEQLAGEGIAARVVSMPSWELFDAQDTDYRESVLPTPIERRLAIEAGSPLGWERYVGPRGKVLGVAGYGASAPYRQLAEHYGFTVANVVRLVHGLFERG